MGGNLFGGANRQRRSNSLNRHGDLETVVGGMGNGNNIGEAKVDIRSLIRRVEPMWDGAPEAICPCAGQPRAWTCPKRQSSRAIVGLHTSW